MAKSRAQKIDEAAEPTEAELEHVVRLCQKHGLDPDDVKVETHLLLLQGLVMMSGFGRNEYTAKLLRVIADMIESPEIETIEEIEKRVDVGGN